MITGTPAPVAAPIVYTPEERALAIELHTIGVEAKRAELARLRLFIHPAPQPFAEIEPAQQAGWCAIARHVLPNTIVWHYLPELPDDETRVLLAIYNPHSDEAVFGFHRAGLWYFDDDMPVDQDTPVYAWAHAPSKAPNKGGAS